jgi:hypothetical protein
LLAALSLLATLLARALALLTLLAALSLLAALARTIRFISHGKVSGLVDRGCAPWTEPSRSRLVPRFEPQNAGARAGILLQGVARFSREIVSKRQRSRKERRNWDGGTERP